MDSRKFRKGFTLIEAMVVLFIFTIVIGASYLLMTGGRKAWRTGDAVIQLQEDIRFAMNDMVYELSETSPSRVTVGAGGSSITFQTPVDENGTGSWEDITFDANPDFYLEDTLDATGAICWGAYLLDEDPSVDSATLPSGQRANRQVRLLLVGDDIRRRVLDSTGIVVEDIVLADDVTNLSFTIDANDVVTINIDTQRQSLDRHPVVYSITSAVSLRNSG